VHHFHLKRIAVAVLLVMACDDGGSQSTPATAASDPAAPARRAMPPVDLCSLVTEAEAESIVGKSLAPPQKAVWESAPAQGGEDCWYLREGGSDLGDVEFLLSFLAANPQSVKEFDDFVAEQVRTRNTPRTRNMKKRRLQTMPFTAEPARGVGAPAYFMDPGLYVLTGNRILVIALSGEQIGGEQGIAIARTALARIPR